jgi:hypothetical protein
MIRAEAEPLPEGTPGYGRIVITGVEPPPGGLSFTLKREGFGLGCLGQRGWQAAEEKLRADSVAPVPGADGWAIVIGPDLARHLRPAPYLLGVPALGVELPVFWPDGIEMPVAPQDLPRPAPRAPAPQRWPDPPPAAPLPAPPPPAAPMITPEARLVPPQAAPVRPAPRRPWAWLAIGAVLLLVAGGVLLRDTVFPPAPGPGEAPPGTIAQPGAPAATPAAVPPPWPEGTDGLPLRDLVAIAPDAAGIRVAAERRQRIGRHDDALALFEEAANRGDGGASLALARLYDPVGFAPGRPFRTPDAFQAARHYQDAVRRGVAAETPRAALRAQLEAQAGDAAAAAILREFWP